MASQSDDPTNRDDIEARIAEIKQRLHELSDGTMVHAGTEDLPPEEQAAFWRNVLAFEEGPFTTDFERLVEAGIQLPAPDSMDDGMLTAKLWEVIAALARMRVFLDNTDHLSDRELYEHLWTDFLRDEIPVTEIASQSAWHVDPLMTGSKESTDAWLKYYADEDTRHRWLQDVPDHVMPPHEDPPHDRDRYLPQADDASEPQH